MTTKKIGTIVGEIISLPVAAAHDAVEIGKNVVEGVGVGTSTERDMIAKAVKGIKLPAIPKFAPKMPNFASLKRTVVKDDTA